MNSTSSLDRFDLDCLLSQKVQFHSKLLLLRLAAGRDTLANAWQQENGFGILVNRIKKLLNGLLLGYRS